MINNPPGEQQSFDDGHAVIDDAAFVLYSPLWVETFQGFRNFLCATLSQFRVHNTSQVVCGRLLVRGWRAPLSRGVGSCCGRVISRETRASV